MGRGEARIGLLDPARDDASALRRPRWWFRCPRTGRRAAKLYLPNGGFTFASRQAYGLVYACQREPAQDRALRRAFKLRAALGSDGGIWDREPRVPPVWNVFAPQLQVRFYIDDALNCAQRMAAKREDGPSTGHGSGGLATATPAIPGTATAPEPATGASGPTDQRAEHRARPGRQRQRQRRWRSRPRRSASRGSSAGSSTGSRLRAIADLTIGDGGHAPTARAAERFARQRSHPCQNRRQRAAPARAQGGFE
jgi:hypothetical protein